MEPAEWLVPGELVRGQPRVSWDNMAWGMVTGLERALDKVARPVA